MEFRAIFIRTLSLVELRVDEPRDPEQIDNFFPLSIPDIGEPIDIPHLAALNIFGKIMQIGRLVQLIRIAKPLVELSVRAGEDGMTEYNNRDSYMAALPVLSQRIQTRVADYLSTLTEACQVDCKLETIGLQSTHSVKRVELDVGLSHLNTIYHRPMACMYFDCLHDADLSTVVRFADEVEIVNSREISDFARDAG